MISTYNFSQNDEKLKSYYDCCTRMEENGLVEDDSSVILKLSLSCIF